MATGVPDSDSEPKPASAPLPLGEDSEPGDPASAPVPLGEDLRLRAVLVLALAVGVEVFWLKVRVCPQFEQTFAQFGGTLPWFTRSVFGWWPYLVAMACAGVGLQLGLGGGAEAGGRRTAAVILLVVSFAGLGGFVLWALYAPLFEVAGAIR